MEHKRNEGYAIVSNKQRLTYNTDKWFTRWLVKFNGSRKNMAGLSIKINKSFYTPLVMDNNVIGSLRQPSVYIPLMSGHYNRTVLSTSYFIELWCLTLLQQYFSYIRRGGRIYLRPVASRRQT